MSSNVEICNQALIGLGEDTISALDGSTQRAVICEQFFEQCRDYCLEKADWNFARAKATLTRLSETPTFGYSYFYQLPTAPNKCVRVRYLNGRENLIEWSVEDGKLATDEETVSIAYTRQITDPTKFSPSFVELLAARLKMKIAYPITKSRSVAQDAKADYLDAEIEALSLESQEGDQLEVNESDDLINVRA